MQHLPPTQLHAACTRLVLGQSPPDCVHLRPVRSLIAKAWHTATLRSMIRKASQRVFSLQGRALRLSRQRRHEPFQLQWAKRQRCLEEPQETAQVWSFFAFLMCHLLPCPCPAMKCHAVLSTRAGGVSESARQPSEPGSVEGDVWCCARSRTWPRSLERFLLTSAKGST